MASRTLGPQTGWAVGETISVYARDSRNVQTGAAITTAAVGADSRVTFTGLNDDLKLIATDGTTAVRFGTATDPAVRKTVIWSSGDLPGRPPGCTYVDWIGPDDPAANSVDGDTWTEPD